MERHKISDKREVGSHIMRWQGRALEKPKWSGVRQMGGVAATVDRPSGQVA